MTQNGFLGTIGWIKSNLMVSSQASEKGYSNETFYPGAENIPESEPKATFLPISFKTSKVAIDENGIANIGGNKGYAVDLLNTPDLSTLQNWELGFKAQVMARTNTDKKVICGIEGADGSWVTNIAFQITLGNGTYGDYYTPWLFSSSDSNYQLNTGVKIQDANWHDFKVKWETGVGYTLTVDDVKVSKYRASYPSNAGKNIRWGFANTNYFTNAIRALDTKSVYLKWWNS